MTASPTASCGPVVGLSRGFKPTPVDFDFVIGGSSVKKKAVKPKAKQRSTDEKSGTATVSERRRDVKASKGQMPDPRRRPEQSQRPAPKAKDPAGTAIPKAVDIRPAPKTSVMRQVETGAVRARAANANRGQIESEKTKRRGTEEGDEEEELDTKAELAASSVDMSTSGMNAAEEAEEEEREEEEEENEAIDERSTSRVDEAVSEDGSVGARKNCRDLRKWKCRTRQLYLLQSP